MIGTSFAEYVFIRGCIFILHFIAPLAFIYAVLFLIIRPSLESFRWTYFLYYWCLAEIAFYLLIYLPRRNTLQHPAEHPALPADQRRKLFMLCHDNVPEPSKYLTKWFIDAPDEEIKRENVKEFLWWAFWNRADPSTDEEDLDEMEEYVEHIEGIIGRELEPGRGNAKCLRLTIDEVDMLHRSLTWYTCVSVVDTITHVRMLFRGFHYHRTSMWRFLKVFPFRPLTLLTTHKSPVSVVTYWHRPHTSTTRLPILFIHGIGIGLYPYVPFLVDLNKRNDPDGQIGIISLEILPVSFRITEAALQKDAMCQEIQEILSEHGWDKFVLVSHSYGSVISTHMLQTPKLSQQIASIVLIDPVSILLHLPDVAYNFTCRKPQRANEHQLHYFASKDMGVAHSLSRHFFWSENILWKQDVDGKDLTVVLGGRDIIVDSEAVRRYLTGDEAWASTPWGPRDVEEAEWEQAEWTGRGLDVIWNSQLDHAQVFDTSRSRAPVVHAVRTYCAQA